MASKNWSATRISTFKSCKLKYLYQYIQHWKSSVPEDKELANKGLVFHETVEQYVTGSNKEDSYKLLEEKVAEYNVDTTKYDEKSALERFFLFWDYFVSPKEKQGYKVLKEEWTNNKLPKKNPYDKEEKEVLIDGPLTEPFVGALDLWLCKENIYNVPSTLGESFISSNKAELVFKDDKYLKIRVFPKEITEEEKLVLKPYEEVPDMIIVDYKSAKTTSVSKYKYQQVLYAYMIGLQRGWTYKEISERVHLYIFFPFGTTEAVSPQDKMLDSIKQISFNSLDVEDIIKTYYVDTIEEIHDIQWENSMVEYLGCPSFACNWCPYKGSIPDNKTGFKGCKMSYDAGERQQRGVYFTREEET